MFLFLANGSGGRNFKLYSKQDETLSHDYRPAFNYDIQTRASQATSRLPQSGLSDSSKYSAPVSLQGQSSPYGRQVAGYSQPRSVPSYKPASHLSSNPRQTFEQPEKVIYRRQGGVWDNASPRNSFGSGVVSSGEIEMHSVPKSSQQPRSSANVHQSKASMWNLPSSQDGEGRRSVSNLNLALLLHAAAKPDDKQPDSLTHLKWDAAAGSNVQSPALHKRIVPPVSSRPASSYYMRGQQLGIPANPPQQRPSVPAKPPQQAGYLANLPKSKSSVWNLSPQSGSGLRSSVLPSGSGLRSSVTPSRATGMSDTAKPYQKHLFSQASGVPLPNADARDGGFGSKKWLKVEPQSSKPVPVSSFYPYEGQRPQLRSMYNRNRQPLAP